MRKSRVERKAYRYGRRPGFQVVQMFGLIAISLMVSALVIDFAYYYAAYNAIHTAADSAALAAATELFRDPQPDPDVRMRDAQVQAQQYLMRNQPNISLQANDVVFGYIDPLKKVYNRVTFATPTADPNLQFAKGYNSVWVKVSKTEDSANGPLNTLMGNLLGVHHMNMEATAVAMVDQSTNTISSGGLRPIYACENQVAQAMQDGILENNQVRIFSDHVEVDGNAASGGCPAKGTGNWSFADFTGCGSSNVGAGTIRDWMGAGYRGTVQANQCYGVRAGDFIANLGEELNGLIAHQTVFPIPMYNAWAGSGKKANVTVNGFVGFKVTNYMASGPESERYIEGHFSRYLCNQGCRSESPAISRPAGSVVKIRLASRS